MRDRAVAAKYGLLKLSAVEFFPMCTQLLDIKLRPVVSVSSNTLPYAPLILSVVIIVLKVAFNAAVIGVPMLLSPIRVKL